MVAKPGEYTFTADGSGQVCGLYVISPPEQVVELEFVDFDIPCETALIAVSKIYLSIGFLGLWCLMPLLALLSYRGTGQFY